MANYELMFIIDPALPEEDRNKSIDKLKAVFDKNSIKIEKQDLIWDQKLAYKINKSSKWYYVLLDLEMDWKEIKNISKDINLDKSIWRYMFTKKEI